jgi:hypothetical protein
MVNPACPSSKVLRRTGHRRHKIGGQMTGCSEPLNDYLSLSNAFIFSLNFGEVRNLTVLLDGRIIASPVRGFLPFLPHMNFVRNFPKREILTSSPLARASFIFSNRELTISVARLLLKKIQSISGNKNICLLLRLFLKRTFSLTRFTMSAFVKVIPRPDLQLENQQRKLGKQ